MTLLIAIGNALRRDDGAAARVLELLGAVEGATAVSCHQLTPELAEDVARARAVVFIDADLEPGPARLEPLAPPAGAAPPSSHFLSPEQLVALATLLYSFEGEAWLCRVPGEDFSDGLGLSARAEASAAAAASSLRQWFLFRRKP